MKLYDEVPNENLVIVPHRLLAGDLSPVDVGSVGALQIRDDVPTVTKKKPSVTLRDIPFGQKDVVSFDATNGQLVVGETLAAFASPFFANDNRDHALALP